MLAGCAGASTALCEHVGRDLGIARGPIPYRDDRAVRFAEGTRKGSLTEHEIAWQIATAEREESQHVDRRPTKNVGRKGELGVASRSEAPEETCGTGIFEEPRQIVDDALTRSIRCAHGDLVRLEHAERRDLDRATPKTNAIEWERLGQID